MRRRSLSFRRLHPSRPRITPPPRPEAVTRAIGWLEEVLYLAVGLFLAAAGAFIAAGAVTTLVEGLTEGHDAVQSGLQVLDRVLLLLIIAELLYTLRLVIYEGEIFAEPFLLIGMIAAVRRVVVVTAQAEEAAPGGRELTNFLLELGVLAGLALAFGAAIYLLRRGAAHEQAAGLQAEPVGESRAVAPEAER